MSLLIMDYAIARLQLTRGLPGSPFLFLFFVVWFGLAGYFKDDYIRSAEGRDKWIEKLIQDMRMQNIELSDEEILNHKKIYDEVFAGDRERMERYTIIPMNTFLYMLFPLWYLHKAKNICLSAVIYLSVIRCINLIYVIAWLIQDEALKMMFMNICMPIILNIYMIYAVHHPRKSTTLRGRVEVAIMASITALIAILSFIRFNKAYFFG